MPEEELDLIDMPENADSFGVNQNVSKKRSNKKRNSYQANRKDSPDKDDKSNIINFSDAKEKLANEGKKRGLTMAANAVAPGAGEAIEKVRKMPVVGKKVDQQLDKLVNKAPNMPRIGMPGIPNPMNKNKDQEKNAPEKPGVQEEDSENKEEEKNSSFSPMNPFKGGLKAAFDGLPFTMKVKIYAVAGVTLLLVILIAGLVGNVTNTNNIIAEYSEAFDASYELGELDIGIAFNANKKDVKAFNKRLESVIKGDEDEEGVKLEIVYIVGVYKRINARNKAFTINSMSKEIIRDIANAAKITDKEEQNEALRIIFESNINEEIDDSRLNIMVRELDNYVKGYYELTTRRVRKTNNMCGGVGSIVDLAREMTTWDIPYVWGGNEKDGLDCSGFVRYVLRELSYDISDFSRVTDGMIAGSWGEHINSTNPKDLQPGDIVFPNSGHVVLWTGEGTVIEAAGEGPVCGNVSTARSIRSSCRGVTENPINQDTYQFVHAIRPPGTNGAQCADTSNIFVIVNGNNYGFEQYVSGVIAAEYGFANLPIEAIKAQAIAIRSYTLARFSFTDNPNGTRTYNAGGASQATQDFGNISNLTETHKQALNETTGMILVDKGTKNPISAEYSGCTEGPTHYKKTYSGNGSAIDPYCNANYYFQYQEYKRTNPNSAFLFSLPYYVGYGHNRGLSQFGAAYLAIVKSYNYTTILDHYYENFEIIGAGTMLK